LKSQEQLTALTTSAMSFYELHLKTRSPTQVKQAIELIKPEIQSCTREPRLAFLLRNLSSILQCWSHEVGTPAELEQAANTVLRSVDLVQDHFNGDQNAFREQIILHLAWYSQMTNKPQFREKAIETCRRAVAVIPNGNPHRARFLSPLSNILADRHDWRLLDSFRLDTMTLQYVNASATS
jgi:hypothetical protein